MVNKKSLATFVRTLGNQVIAGFKHFLNNVKVGGDLIISPNSLGSPATNVLTVDGSGVVKTATAFTGISVDSVSKVKHEVKAGVAINKGQAVYVTGADGTNMIVGLASNASEATSSKTMGLSESTLAINGKGNVVTEGLLDGLDTTGATAGDPVWLGTGGNLIYGLAGKPYAPANLVFIGIVTRVNVSNGEIFVKVQNGFELNEIHDVDLKTNVPVNGEILGFNGTLWVNKTIAGWLGYTPANASGTTNYVSKFTGTTTLGNSQIFDNGTNVGIGTATPSYKLDINGTFRSNAFFTLSNGVSYWGPNGSEYGYLTWDSGYAKVAASNANTLYLGGSNQITILSGGNVGIGTTSPAFKLEVNAGSNAGMWLQGSSDVRYHAFSSSSNDWVGYELRSSNVNSFAGGMFRNNGANNRVSLYNKNSEAISLMDAGNVGIGTTSPTNTLDVLGSATIRNSSGGGALNIGTNSGRTEYQYITLGGGTGVTDYGWQVGRSPQTGGVINDGFYIYDIKTNNAPFTIALGGNVGIGTTSPGTKLQVVGTISAQNNADGSDATGIRIYGSGTSKRVDFVAADASVNERISGIGTGGIGTMTFSVNNDVATLTERMRITSAGNVGIGTTAPNYKLDVNGSINIYSGNSLRWGSGDVEILNSGYSMLFSTYTGSALTEKMRITSTGNVGIGTTAPAYNLDVQANTTSEPYVQARFLNTNSSGTEYGGILVNGTNQAHIRFLTGTSTWDGAGAKQWQIRAGFGSNIDALSIYSWTAGAEVIYFNSSGNVGIGNTAPSQKLHVTGNVRVTGSYYDSNNESGTSGQILTSTVTGTDWKSKSELSLVDGSGTANYVSKWSDTDTLTNSQIFDNGTSVGIGTATPSYKLDINGVTRFQDIVRFKTNSWNLSDEGWGRLYFGANGRTYFGSVSGYEWRSAADAALAVITDAGNVGIGTTAPGAKLDIAYATNPTTATPHIILSTGGTTKQAAITAESFAIGGLIFSTGDGTLVDRMTILRSNGNVGIGTTSPGSKLHVNGGFIRVEGSSVDQYFLEGVRTGGATTLRIYDNSSIPFYDSYSTMYFRANQNGGSGGIIGLFGGNVGINTTSPATRLHVDASGHAMVVSNDSGNRRIYFGTGGTGEPDIQATLSNGTARQLSINAAGGNVGIGTTSPFNKLTVGSVPASGYGLITISADWASGSAISTGIKIGAAADTGGAGVDIRSHSNYAASSGTEMSFWTNSTGNVLSERMRITSAGNVGIGTTSPNEKLHVAGNIHAYAPGGIDAGLYASTLGGLTTIAIRSSGVTHFNGGNVGIGTSSPNERLSLAGSTSTTFGLSLEPSGWNGAKHRFTVPTSGDASILSYNFNGSSVDFASYSSSSITLTQGVLAFGTGGVGAIPTERMRITSGGTVLMNTTVAPTTGGFTNTTLSVKQIADGLYGGGLQIEESATESVAYFGFNGSAFNIGTSYRATGNYRPITFSTNGSERLRIANDGNVGIGTTAPITKLSIGAYSGSRLPYINGTANTFDANGITVTSSNTANAAIGGGIDLTNNVHSVGSFSPLISFSALSQSGTYNNNYAAIYGILAGDSGDGNWNSGHLVFATALAYGASEKMRITNAGNVGIGTTSPANKLVAVADATFNGENSYAIAAASSTDVAYKTIVGYDYANDVGVISAVRTGIQWKNLSILPVGNTNLGVGTLSPSQRLHVSGNLRVTGAYYDSNNSAGSSGQVLSSTGSGTDWVSLSEITGVDGTGTANYIAKWSDTDTITNSQVFDNGTNVGINNASPKTKLDVNGTIGFGGKNMSMTDTFAAALTINMNDHNGCYVKLTAFGDWGNHSTIAYLGEFFIQASAGSYNEPGIIIRQVDNTSGGDDIQAQIVDPAGTGTRDFVIQLKATSASNTPFTAYLQYEVRGQYNSVS